MSSHLVSLVLCLCLLPAFWAGAARAGQPGPLGLETLIELARLTSSQVRQTGVSQNWEQEKVLAAQRKFFPRLDLDLAHQPKVDYFGRPVQEDDTYTSEVKLTQPLYTGGQLTARYDQAKQGLARVGLNEAKARLEAAQEMVPVYYRLLAARETAAVGRDLVAKADVLVASARQGVKEGYQLLEDLLRAEARLLEVTYKVTETSSQARAAAYRLKELIGYDRDQALEVRPQAPEYERPGQVEMVVEQAMQGNAALALAKAEDQYQSLGLTAASALSMPRFNLIGRYGLEGDDFPGPDKYAGVMLQCDISFGDVSAKAFYDYEHQYQNDVSFYFKDQELHRKGLRLSFLDGNSPAVTQAEAAYQRRKAHDEVRDLRAKLQTQVMSLWEELKRHDELFGLGAKQADLNAERVSVARARAEAGAATPAEVLEREMDLAESRAKMIQARYDRYRVEAMLSLIAGQPLVCKDAQ